jgi:hypothetical protein
MTAGGPALVSSRRGLTGELELGSGELHYTCASGKDLRHFRRDAGGPWSQVAVFGTGAYSGPCMIEILDEEGDELSAGPMHLFVELANRIEHWVLQAPSPLSPSPQWGRMTTFGTDVRRVIGALRGSSTNLEIVVERTDGQYELYVRRGINWVGGTILP